LTESGNELQPTVTVRLNKCLRMTSKQYQLNSISNVIP